MHEFITFCLGTGVPRHSAGGIGTFIRMYMVHIICNVHTQVIKPENSIGLSVGLSPVNKKL